MNNLITSLPNKKLVAHNKIVTNQQIEKYGELASYHIQIPILIAYEGLERIFGEAGMIKKLDRKFIDKLRDTTNNYIKAKHKNHFSKFLSKWKGEIEEVKAISLIKDHNAKSIDHIIGHTIGLFYTLEIDGVYSLFVNGLIEDLEAKYKIDMGIWQQTSFGSYDDVIKEISFVVREAIPNCGVMMSESNNIESPIIEKLNHVTIENPEIDKITELNELKMAEAKLENILIPNTKIARRMVQNGQILPFKAKELIEFSTPEVLLMMEKCMPVHKLNIITGIGKEPSELNTSPVRSEQVLKMSEISKYAQKSSKEMAKKTNTQIKENANNLEHTKQILQQEMIDYNYQLKSEKKQVLEDILQMCEQNPEYIKDYVEFELGINKNQVDNEHNSPSLQSALFVLQNIRKQKQLLMGEKNEL
jgi:hypothetical protein